MGTHTSVVHSNWSRSAENMLRALVSLTLLCLPNLGFAVELGFRSLESYPGAICNDGSVASYYVEQGDYTAGQTIMVYLGGGGACTSANDCTDRCTERRRSGSAKLTRSPITRMMTQFGVLMRVSTLDSTTASRCTSRTAQAMATLAGEMPVTRLEVGRSTARLSLKQLSPTFLIRWLDRSPLASLFSQESALELLVLPSTVTRWQTW